MRKSTRGHNLPLVCEEWLLTGKEPEDLSGVIVPYMGELGFPGGSDGEESTCKAGDLGSIPGLGRPPGGGHGNLLQYSSLEHPHGQRDLAGYSPWGRKELDTTERLSTGVVMDMAVVTQLSNT